MIRTKRILLQCLVLALLLLFLPSGWPPRAVLVLAAFDAPRGAYEEIIARFQKDWFDRTGRRVEVRASFKASAAQSRAVAAGFPADVAAFAHGGDMARLERAGLITHDWRVPRQGAVSASLVALAVREGNPAGIRGWGDLARKGVKVLAPHPKVAPGAAWIFLALYGVAERGAAPPYRAGDEAAFGYCKAVYANALSLDASASRALRRFEQGWGDAVVAWESDILEARARGARLERVLPRSTVMIEHPAAVVDVNADRHGVRPEAEAFLAFLRAPEAQAIFARRGFRPIDSRVLNENRRVFPPLPDLWSVQDYGGWSEVGTVFFGPGGLFDSVLEELHAPS
jgi:sulfate/thiosulfate transport system substrate-binding protein